MARPTIAGLDIVRFAAAAMVMCFHLCSAESLVKPDHVLMTLVGSRVAFPELYDETWFGWLGVEIFFVISGIVIVYSAEGSTAGAFLRSRVLRLYPAALVCASLTAATSLMLGITSYHHLLREYLDSITLFPISPWVDDVYWTLGIEMSFYTIILTLLIVKRFQYIERVAVMLGIVSSAYWILNATVAPSLLKEQVFNRALELSLVLYGCYFSIGVLTYAIARGGRGALSVPRLLAMLLFITAAFIEIGDKTVAFNANCDANAMCAVRRSALLPQIVFLVALGCIFVSMRGLLRPGERFSHVIRMIGLATYPLYLVHLTVGAAIIKFVLTMGGSRYVALASAILLCLAGSVFIAGLVEPPLKALLRRLLVRVGDLPAWDRFVARPHGIH